MLELVTLSATGATRVTAHRNPFPSNSGKKLYFAQQPSRSLKHSTVIVINYTLHPEGNCSEMVDDVCRAIAWTKTLIMQRSKEHTPLILMGHSAGAHLCAMAVVKRALSEAGLRAEEGGILGWSCSDLSGVKEEGGREGVRSLSAGVYHTSYHVSPSASPCMIARPLACCSFAPAGLRISSTKRSRG